MNKEKLAEIGGKLDITKEEFRNIHKQRRKEKINTILTGGIISIISMLTGYFIGKNSEPRMEHRGYPYGMLGSSFCCGAGMGGIMGGFGFLYLLTYLNGKKKHKTMMSILVLFFIILSVIAIIFGHEVGRPVEYYSGAIDYGVFSRDQRVVNNE